MHGTSIMTVCLNQQQCSGTQTNLCVCNVVLQVCMLNMYVFITVKMVYNSF